MLADQLSLEQADEWNLQDTRRFNVVLARHGLPTQCRQDAHSRLTMAEYG